MKIKLLIVFILTTVFGVVVLARGIYLKNFSGSKEGFLTVEASPASSVFLDDNLIGKTPVQSFQLSVGKHKIKVIPEGIAGDTATWEGKIEVTDSSLTYVSVNLGKNAATTAVTIAYITNPEKKLKKDTGAIVVDTEPAGAIVYLNNDEKGVAPIRMEEVPLGAHEIRVSLPFFFNRIQKIKLRENEVVNLYFKLAVDESQKKVDLPDQQDQDVEESEQKEQSNKKVRIKETPTGWLRVRSRPGLGGQELAKVKTGAVFELLEEDAGWVKIRFNNRQEDLESGEFEEGWVSGRYIEELDNQSQQGSDSNQATSSADTQE